MKTRNAFQIIKKQERITDGSEKKNEKEEKNEEKLNEKEDIKLSKSYCKLAEKMDSYMEKENGAVDWLKMLIREKESGKLSEKEAGALKQIYKDKLEQIRDKESKEVTHNIEKDTEK